MTDVRRTGSPKRVTPKRLTEETVGIPFEIPIEGEVDGIWQRAFHAHLTEEIRRQPELFGAESFGQSLTINPGEIKFYLVGSATLLPHYLDMIESAIPQANQTAAVERQRLAAAVAEAQRELRDRDEDIERALKSWAEQQSADS
jgi:hypothetical protein